MWHSLQSDFLPEMIVVMCALFTNDSAVFLSLLSLTKEESLTPLYPPESRTEMYVRELLESYEYKGPLLDALLGEETQ